MKNKKEKSVSESETTGSKVIGFRHFNQHQNDPASYMAVAGNSNHGMPFMLHIVLLHLCGKTPFICKHMNSEPHANITRENVPTIFNMTNRPLAPLSQLKRGFGPHHPSALLCGSQPGRRADRGRCRARPLREHSYSRS